VTWHVPGVVQSLSPPLLPLSLSIVVRRCCHLSSVVPCSSSVIGFPGVVGSQHPRSTPRAVAREAGGGCVRLALCSVVAAVSGCVCCNVVVTVEPRNKTKKLVTSKKKKAYRGPNDSFGPISCVTWHCCCYVICSPVGAESAGESAVVVEWKWRWRGEAVLLVVVTMSKSGTTWCVRMNKYMQMVRAHLGIFKRLTFQLFQLECSPHIVV
jgi:hypothetical protein